MSSKRQDSSCPVEGQRTQRLLQHQYLRYAFRSKALIDIGVSERILSGDISLVNELAQINIGGKPRKFYSFASKYCNHHNPEAFPIYDNYVDKMLRHFRRVDKFAEFRSNELKNYVRFVEIVKLFRSGYDLDQFSLREIDIYLWLAGKDEFSRWSVEQRSEKDVEL